MLDWLTDPYAFDFMQRALVASLIVGAVAPLVGTWIVLQRLSYMGDAMGHATLGGVGLAYLAGWSMTGGAVMAGVAMAGLMALLSTHPRLHEDAVIGIVEVTLFSVGVLVISSSGNVGVDLGQVLFGSINTVTPADLRLNALLGLVALVGSALLFTDLRAATFDPLHARLAGVRVAPLRAGLLVLLAITVVLALQTVGLLMSIALLIIPAAAARLWVRTIGAMAALGAVLGVGCCVIGLTLSFHLASAPGATISLVAVAVLAVSFAVTLPRRGRAPATHAADLRSAIAGQGGP